MTGRDLYIDRNFFFQTSAFFLMTHFSFAVAPAGYAPSVMYVQAFLTKSRSSDVAASIESSSMLAVDTMVLKTVHFVRRHLQCEFILYHL